MGNNQITSITRDNLLLTILKTPIQTWQGTSSLKNGRRSTNGDENITNSENAKARVFEFVVKKGSNKEKLLGQLQEKYLSHKNCQYLTHILSIQNTSASGSQVELLCSSEFKITRVLVEKPQTSLYRYLKLHKRRKTVLKEVELISVIYCGCLALQFLICQWRVDGHSTQPNDYKFKFDFGLNEMYITQNGIIKLEDPELRIMLSQSMEIDDVHYENCVLQLSKGQEGVCPMLNLLAIALSLALLREIQPDEVKVEMIEQLRGKYPERLLGIFRKMIRWGNQRHGLNRVKQYIEQELDSQSPDEESLNEQVLNRRKDRKMRVTLAHGQHMHPTSGYQSIQQSSHQSSLQLPRISTTSHLTNSLMEINLDKYGIFTFTQKKERNERNQNIGHQDLSIKDRVDLYESHRFPRQRFLRKCCLSNSFEAPEYGTAQKNISHNKDLTRQTSHCGSLGLTNLKYSQIKRQIDPQLRSIDTKVTEPNTEIQVCQIQDERSYILQIMNEGMSGGKTNGAFV